MKHTFIVVLILATEWRLNDATYELSKVEIPTCNGTNMTHRHRKNALEAHNDLRAILQDIGPRRRNRLIKLPTSDYINVLAYDFHLENSAYNIAKLCLNESRPDFNYTGSNNFTSSDKDFILSAIWSWLATLETHPPLVNVTPSVNDTKKIPALQMFNGNTTKLGCAFHYCSSSLLSFVCKYEDSPLKVGAPLYTVGSPCGKCNGSCVSGLCNNTVV